MGEFFPKKYIPIKYWSEKNHLWFFLLGNEIDKDTFVKHSLENTNHRV